jgi:chorismate synthase
MIGRRMATLTYRTAGESHGKTLIAMIEGMPVGVTLDNDLIDAELRRRQGGYGRGGRQRIETDKVEFLTGIRRGKTTGAPLTLQVINRDIRIDDAPAVSRPRPGHADLAGSLKWLTTDCREILERASARETAARVAAGAVARCLLREFEIDVVGFVVSIGSAVAQDIDTSDIARLRAARDASEVYCPDPVASEKMCQLIRQAKIDGDTLGGLVEAHVFNCPPGLGSCMQYDARLDARLAMAVMGIQAFKAVEIGLGKDAAFLPGSQVHDEIAYDPSQKDRPSLGYTRKTNRAGGLEGGITNGQPIVVRGAMKPIATLLKALNSVDLITHQAERASYERSDVCAVSAAGVVMENVVAFEVARSMVEKFAGDSLAEMRANYQSYLALARRLPL